MKYYYLKKNSKIEYLGVSDEDGAEIIESPIMPAREYREGYEAVLSYNETDGIHYEYASIPTENAGVGKDWVLNERTCEYELIDRPLTADERISIVEDEIAQQKYPWKANEAVNVGDRRYYNDKWYRCIQAHTTQADWTPDIVPALWSEE